MNKNYIDKRAEISVSNVCIVFGFTTANILSNDLEKLNLCQINFNSIQ